MLAALFRAAACCCLMITMAVALRTLAAAIIIAFDITRHEVDATRATPPSPMLTFDLLTIRRDIRRLLAAMPLFAATRCCYITHTRLSVADAAAAATLPLRHAA